MLQRAHRTAIANTILLILLAFAATPLVAADETTVSEQLYQWQVSTTAVPVHGVSWSFDTASWTLESGTLRFLAPTADGTVTGFVFEGTGQFQMTVPDPFEREQLARFAEDPSLTSIDSAFTRMVLRVGSSLPSALPTPPEFTGSETSSVLRSRHERWLLVASRDVDARVLAAQLGLGADFMCATMDTASHGWLTYEFEPMRPEEIQLVSQQRTEAFPEVWVSLDRIGQRRRDGSPMGQERPLIDVRHVDSTVDLRQHGGSPVRRGHRTLRDVATFRTAITFEALTDGIQALELKLSPFAEVHSATTADGTQLDVVRDHVGGRFLNIDPDLWDDSMVVLLDAPLTRGSEHTLVFSYDMKIYNYATGNSWYPLPAYILHEPVTATVSITAPAAYDVRATGHESSRTTKNGELLSVWEVNEPTMMVGFCFGERFREEVIEAADGAPEVVVFGSSGGLSTGNMLRNVAADLTNSLRFYSWYFDMPLDCERLWATGIAGSHGQAFEGFLHLSDYTFEGEHPGATELFRAHEVAHQYWGHRVGWASYRDQWLSEAFAEYSAMLFIEATMQKQDMFRKILESYTNEQLGSIRGALGTFARPWDTQQIRYAGDELGPIAAGYRASTAEIPTGYQIQSYRKGALVLHMIRRVLHALSPEEDLFRSVLQEFLRRFDGRIASTADFRTLLEERTNMDWSQFFSSWVEGCEIPTYRWDWKAQRADGGGWTLVIGAEQDNVSDQFAAPVPVGLEFRNGQVAELFLPVGAEGVQKSIPLPAKPVNVDFNSGFGVLAETKRDRSVLR